MPHIIRFGVDEAICIPALSCVSRATWTYQAT